MAARLSLMRDEMNIASINGDETFRIASLRYDPENFTRLKPGVGTEIMVSGYPLLIYEYTYTLSGDANYVLYQTAIQASNDTNIKKTHGIGILLSKLSLKLSVNMRYVQGPKVIMLPELSILRRRRTRNILGRSTVNGRSPRFSWGRMVWTISLGWELIRLLILLTVRHMEFLILNTGNS